MDRVGKAIIKQFEEKLMSENSHERVAGRMGVAVLEAAINWIDAELERGSKAADVALVVAEMSTPIAVYFIAQGTADDGSNLEPLADAIKQMGIKNWEYFAEGVKQSSEKVFAND